MTLRFDAALQAIGFASSGEAGVRLATFLGMPTSPSTVLRRTKGTSFPSKQVTKVGIDDFAFRRGLKYGSILVDLETRRVVDLLPDRSVATATAWFKKHPEIRVISRDRGADYATAASQGSPQAVQVADRWHIVHNLSETLSFVLEHYHAQLRSVSHVLVPPPLAEPEKHRQDEDVSERSSSPIPIASAQPYRAPFTQRVQQTRRESRLQRYQQIVELQRQGMTITHIAPQVGLSSRTIRRWLTQKQSVKDEDDPASLIPMNPTCLCDGSKDVTMDFRSGVRSRLVAILALQRLCIIIWLDFILFTIRRQSSQALLH